MVSFVLQVSKVHAARSTSTTAGATSARTAASASTASTPTPASARQVPLLQKLLSLSPIFDENKLGRFCLTGCLVFARKAPRQGGGCREY